MLELLHELNLDPKEFHWGDLALCANSDTETYFDKYESDVEVAKAVDAGCLLCPVQTQCFFKGAKGETGVWGGIYFNGAGKPDKNKNAHKTDAVWSDMYRRVS